ncbi:MAG TPA: NAD-dependent epimerase/dehydratase family protein [Firmicutes bacterium]|nr:NAD-dependent epimerase/dehydratase family protein [Bacillota bacterium]
MRGLLRKRCYICVFRRGALRGRLFPSANEESPLRPQLPYGIAKLAGELYLQHYSAEHGLNSVALRYGNVYGPRQDPAGEAGMVAIFASKMLKVEKVTINGDGEYIRDYVFVKDMVDTNLRAPERCSHNRGARAFNVGTSCGTSVNQLYRMRASVLGVAVEPNYGPPGLVI